MENLMRVCKVYCTYFGTRRTFPTSSPGSAEEALIVFKKNIENDLTLNCGIQNMDIIVVNNYSNQITKEGQQYLSSINELNTPYGKIIVRERENTGASMGAFSYAFNMFGDEYDYWLFIEDDIRIIFPEYYKMIINEFQNDSNLGFLALNYIINENTKNSYVCGGMGASKKEILMQIKEKFGKLPYDTGSGLSNYAGIGLSEHMFTNCYNDIGYKIRTPIMSDVNLLADNWEKFSTHVAWQRIKKFNLKNNKHFCHVGI